MSDSILVDQSKEFAVDILTLCESIRSNGKSASIINQLLRSGTSIGANIHEANYASGKLGDRQTSKTFFVNGIDHVSLVTNYNVRSFIIQLINGNTSTSLYNNISANI